MKPRPRLVSIYGVAFVIGFSLLTAVALSQDSLPPITGIVGRSDTFLSDGNNLLLGGQINNQAIPSATVLDLGLERLHH